MGKFFNNDDDEFNEYGKYYKNSISKKDENDDDQIKNKEGYINSKLIDLGIYRGEGKVSSEDYLPKDLIKIDGELFLKKKELTNEDELYLKLKTIDILQRNQEIMEEHKDNLRIIKYILTFFTILIVISVVTSIFIGVKTVKKSKYLYLYPYEQKMEVEKDL